MQKITSSRLCRSLLNRVLGVLACSHACCVCILTGLVGCLLSVLACLRAYMPGVLAYLRTWCAWRAYMFACLRAWCACVCACLL